MEKFAIGDFVANGEVIGNIVAVFMTTEGLRRYAVESDGVLQFALESELALYRPQDRAA